MQPAYVLSMIRCYRGFDNIQSYLFSATRPNTFKYVINKCTLNHTIDAHEEIRLKAPVAGKIPHTITAHGLSRTDEYHWLRDEHWQKIVAGDLDFHNSDILDYLKAEAAYKDHHMAASQPVQERLYGEILSRIKEDYQSWPVTKGDFFYYYREEQGLNYPILCRRHGAMTAPEEVYLDVNQEADGKDLYMFGPSVTNRANTFLAYGYNLTGSMERTIRVRNLATGLDCPWRFHNSTGSVLWLDNDHLLIVERDEQARGKHVYRVNIHQGPEHKELLFSKPDEFDAMFLSLGETTDREYVLVYLESGGSQVVYYSPRSAIDFALFAHGTNDVVFHLDHYRGDFYILTNRDGANNFQLFKAPVGDVQQWQLLQAQSDTISLTDIHFYSHYLVIEQKNNDKALEELVVQDMNTGQQRTVTMPDEAYELDFSGDWDHNATTVRLDYSSPVMPATVLELDLATVQTKRVYTRDTPNFDPSKYVVKREYATARDGERIPVTIIHQQGLVRDGSHHAFIYGYGSYGYGMTAGFSSKLFSLVDRGFVYATAHIRGGDEKGYGWYLDGKMRHKMNTFYDFIDVTEYLVEQGYTARQRIAINGGSAGGLLMGAVTNLRPDLFGCVVADVPFVDVINTISDASLPLTPPEWEEWGNPLTSVDDYNYILSYSPYDNVQAVDYPPMLFNSGISDEQVTYWEPAKMVARLRALKTDDNLLLLNMNMHAGHAGASKRYEWIDEVAFNYAFVLRCFNIKQ